ncbi:synaptosomal-associated protein 47 isoform X2 [Mobula birostris]|uniref:synaptosomal-associated protein 47 isoform X2 n=1 Tax=Mobula birostris TaxID=1983395 RepID=UPI003B285B4E
MNRDLCIHSWPGSYYLQSEKRWVYGKLSLTPYQLAFTSDKERVTLISFKLSSITGIKKETSSFIFSSLTVLVGDGEKHWFSSLQPNRTVVFNVLEHFWRAQLLSSEGEEMEADTRPMSKGRELINLASSSQQRLGDTAKVLHHQGEQFDRIMKGLDKIESDLDVANRLLTELESPPWWPFSSRLRKSQQEVKDKPESLPSSQAFGKDGLILKVPILYSQGPDANLKQEIQYAKKVQFKEDLLGLFRPEDSSVSENLGMGSSLWNAATGFLDRVMHPASASGGQMSQQVCEQTVSEAEVQELRQVLRKLKSIALDTEAELERQNEVLDVIGSSTDQATSRINTSHRRIRKLL